jgi:predicted RNA binding protein YcfA (HicA-like mRNA interferase family)
MNYREMVQLLKRYGYQLLRQARGAHEIWKHRFGSTILVTRSGLKDARSRQNWLRDLRVGAAVKN